MPLARLSSLRMRSLPDNPPYRHILIIADIEGSSGCGDYQASSFMTRSWARACAGMSRDVDAVVRGLLDAGVRMVTVKDFHRTAFNLLPELIDSRARIVCGYRRGPVPGLGHPEGAEAVMLVGMHAASGTEGFLAHTLTSRLSSVTVNGRPLAEVELFASSLAPFGIPPIFLSGCPAACDQARERIPGIETWAIDKRIPPHQIDADRWRKELAQAAVDALANRLAAPYCLQGPVQAEIVVRDGADAAARMADPWGFARIGDVIRIDAPDIHALYDQLIRLCYLPPLAHRTLPFSLHLFNLIGRAGRWWVRRQLAASTGD